MIERRVQVFIGSPRRIIPPNYGLEVQNVVLHVDGTVRILPELLRTRELGWWYFDGQIYYQRRLRA